MINYARNQYLEKWLEFFSDNKTKKDIWEQLNKSLNIDISLSKFYLKAKNPIDYLDEKFNFYNIPKILDVLEIEDSIIVSKLEETRMLDQNVENLLLKIKSSIFR